MKIRRIAISNFRNFRSLDVRLHDHAVVVGANGVGKSNLLHALRIVLDPSLPDSLRHLRQEDFWDGLPRPVPKDVRIDIVVELTDFEKNDDQLAGLAEYLVETDPMVARLTYVFRAKPTATDPPAPDEFEFFMFGGDREENRAGYDIRRRMPVDFFHALRDAEGDLAAWRRSPLRPLLERAWAQVKKPDKEALAKGVEEATELIAELAPLTKLAETITRSLSKHVGEAHSTDVQLGVGPREAEALIRVVRLLLDDRRRVVGEASLGLANVLFFTLKLLELERLVESHDRDHTFVAIEEPEAHLHPHLQRQMFRSFLRLRPHLAVASDKPLEALPTTILVTTHSPHLASIAPIESLVLLRQERVELPPEDSAGEPVVALATVATSMALAEFDVKEKNDLERYIEVTRAEMLFARGVLLVEGEAEMYLVPRIAELHGVDLGGLGISVCSVGGTHFRSFALFLEALQIPFAVITDGDPDTDRPGDQRMLELLEDLLGTEGYEKISKANRLATARENGLFVGDTTFELDLLHEGRTSSIPQALLDLTAKGTARTRAEGWKNDPTTIDEPRLLTDIAAIGKGRFAQRLSSNLRKKKTPPQGPKYVIAAIEYVVAKVRA